MTTSPKGRMTAIVLLPLEMSMPTEFICIPPTRICNRNPSFSHCRFNLLGDANSMAQPAQIERCNKRMANSLSNGHKSPRRQGSASCSSYCSLGTRWKESRTGCPAFLSKFIVIGGDAPSKLFFRKWVHTSYACCLLFNISHSFICVGLSNNGERVLWGSVVSRNAA